MRIIEDLVRMCVLIRTQHILRIHMIGHLLLSLHNRSMALRTAPTFALRWCGTFSTLQIGHVRVPLCTREGYSLASAARLCFLVYLLLAFLLYFL